MTKDTQSSDPALAACTLQRSLSAQLLALTVLFVLLAEAIVLAPSLAYHRVAWFERRLEQAYIVSIALESPERAMIKPDTMKRLFDTAGVVGLVVDRGGMRKEEYTPGHNSMRYHTTLPIAVEDRGWPMLIADAWGTFLSKGEYVVRVTGKPRFAGGAKVEVFISQAALRRDLHEYASNILILSLIISTLTGLLFYVAVDRVIVRPVRGLTQSMAKFNENPEEPTSILEASKRLDELGEAERGLRAMEERVQNLLAERRRLAALGAGISKISHDLRNILASAQLMSDRLAKSEDPRMRQLAPRLIQALDRAVTLSRDTLSYGRMTPETLKKTRFSLTELVDEALGDAAHSEVEMSNQVPQNITLLADKTQIYRALFNLAKNAVEAIAPAAQAISAQSADAAPPPAPRGSISISGRIETGKIVIDMADSGPGIPTAAREKLFEPFQGSLKPGGTGLGVAIAYEIIKAHGGMLTLSKSDATGATFTLELPLA